MNATLQVTLDAELVEALKQTAAQQGVGIENVLADLARKYLREARREKIRREFECYQAMHTELKAKYLGQHVAIHEGRLVDHDADAGTLAKRVRQRFGRLPVMLAHVEDEPIKEYVFRSPRLERAE
ncbi:MAG: hypothetical protein AAB427_10690 [Chloroflexota bacterium]